MKILLLTLLLSFSTGDEMDLLRYRRTHNTSKAGKCMESPFETYRRDDVWLRIHRGKTQKCRCRRRAICHDVHTEECATNNCLNGGSCAKHLRSEYYVCRCPHGYTGKHCEIDIKSQCITERGRNYRGTRNYTKSGSQCLRWDSAADRERNYNARRSDALNLGLGSHNFCRNPDNDRKPWCYIEGKKNWDFCDIPKCQTEIKSKCGKRQHKMKKIVGGLRATIESHPWQAALYITGRRYINPAFQCGASLIHPCWVLTAAHCFNTNVSPTDYRVLLGKSSISEHTKNEQNFSVEKIIIHQRYNEHTYDNDIALLKLKSQSGMCAKETESVQTVCLPLKYQRVADGTQCEISGYGMERAFSPFFSKFLKEAKVHIISQQLCRSSQYYGKKLTDNMLCAAHPAWTADSCHGDSGGPLVCENDGQMYLYGVISWGEGCAQKNKPGIYTRVTNYLQWIEENMAV
ncbi:tissue-type plasminogen activator-like isoform X1 [Mobula hypostoma]|uniref:tissue-type plasminogen activator-like isoform X1 n=1 Tax=Mobula hypostoma TaxID=723540 RepID=UPI002FC2D464